MEYSIFNNDLHSKKATNIKENIIELRKKIRSGSGFQDSRIIMKRRQTTHQKNPDEERRLMECVIAQ